MSVVYKTRIRDATITNRPMKLLLNLLCYTYQSGDPRRKSGSFILRISPLELRSTHVMSRAKNTITHFHPCNLSFAESAQKPYNAIKRNYSL